MLIQENLSIEQKLRILTDAAKYDVACTSSGVDRKGRADGMGSATDIGICHSFAADGRCISLLKILLTNQCIYDCKYCVNRCSNDVVRTAFTPDEVCTLTMEFYRRNYIEGLFLSSGILYSADYTMELIYETLLKLRTTCRFNGYIHVKGIPGADQELIARVGYLADRMSVNLELPTAQGLRDLAPGKTRDKILRPMRQIQRGIAAQSLYLEGDRGFKKAYDTGRAGFAGGAALLDPSRAGGVCAKESPSERAENPGVGSGAGGAGSVGSMGSGLVEGAGVLREENVVYSVKTPRQSASSGSDRQSAPLGTSTQSVPLRSSGPAAPSSAGAFDGLASRDRRNFPPVFEEEKHLGIPEGRYGSRRFVPAGQSTQMIVGATPENDFQMLTVTQALYRSYGLKRVFFSAYVPVNLDSSLPALPGGPPLLREHRLYQADWLLRFYGFRAEELLDASHPDFNPQVDPKCSWALRHLDFFPVEVNRADYEALLRIPGVGVVSAKRILVSRRARKLRIEDLPKLGVVMKRAQYFLTASGRMADGLRFTPDSLLRNLIAAERPSLPQPELEQMSLFAPV